MKKTKQRSVASSRRKTKRNRKAKTFSAFVSLLSLIYSLAVRINDRKQVIKVLQDPDTFETVVKIQKEQKN